MKTTLNDPSNVWIGFDRDGTLVSPKSDMPPVLCKSLHRLAAAGYNLFIASGKSLEFIRDEVQAKSLPMKLLAGENGGHIDAPGRGEVIAKASQDITAFRLMVQSLTLPKSGPEPKYSIWSRKFGQNADLACSILSKFIKDHGWDLEVFAHPDVDGGVDVVPPHIHKGIVDTFIPQEASVHFFGDSYNDLPLMKIPRVTPHAPGNAKPEVKALVHARFGIVGTGCAGHCVLGILQQLFPH